MMDNLPLEFAPFGRGDAPTARPSATRWASTTNRKLIFFASVFFLGLQGTGTK